MELKTKMKLIRKEIVEEVRSIKSMAIILILNVVLLLCVTTMFYSVMGGTSNGYTSNYKAVLYMYNNLIFIEFIVILIVIPLIAGASYAREFESGTLDLLLLTSLRTEDILMAKIARVITFNMFLVLTTLPMLCVVFSVGGVGVWDILKYIIIVFSTTLFFGSIGVYFSVKFEDSLKGVMATFLVEIIGTIGIQGLLKVIYMIADRIKNMTFYSGSGDAAYNKLQFSNLGTFLIVNPMYDIFKLQSDIVGSKSSYDITMNDFGVHPVLEKIWIFVSVIIFIIVAIFMINKTKKMLLKKFGK